jgi:acetate kinase
MKILVLNSGSSSQKTKLYEVGGSSTADAPDPLWSAQIEWSDNSADIEVTQSKAESSKKRVKVISRREALEQLLRTLWSSKSGAITQPNDIDVVGHRIVHGGPKFDRPVIITNEVKQAIAGMSSFAPLHNRAELEGIELIEQLINGVAQAAVFDTAFHHNLPLAAAVYPGPYSWFERSIRRYGFHGINHEYCAARTAELLRRDLRSLKLVSCHLGNGCSLAAIDGGRSIDTTMGFTPLEGLMMGTRSGSIDPAILIYLMRQDHATPDDLDRILNEQSGLLGISGTSGDMRAIREAANSGNERAQLAFAMFVHRLHREIGAMATVLGGMDGLIFTAGIGERSPELRTAVCAKLGFLGLKLDEAKNSAPQLDCDIAVPESRVRVLVIGAEEDWAIARSCWSLLKNSPGRHSTAKRS